MTPNQTEQPIEQMNKIIAEFDGWEFRDNEGVISTYKDGRLKAVSGVEKLAEIIDAFEYHSSWEELHSAWDKLYKWYAESENSSVKICLDKQVVQPMSNAMITGNITEAHRILYEGISWFNKQSK